MHVIVTRILLTVHEFRNALAEEVENLKSEEASRGESVADGGGGIMGGKQNVVLEKLYLQIPELVMNALM